MGFRPIAVLREKVASLQKRWHDARQEIERLRKENEDLRQDRERLQREKERLREENERLKRQLEQAHRANKRQAAPFSRHRRKQNPEKPGRKPGSAYGKRYSKVIPDEVDEVIAVPPPTQCDCGGLLEVERIESQYQQEIVRKTIWRRFDIAICRCKQCKKRVQGRDPRQTSDALGAAAVQLGPEVLALAVKMNKGLGMPHADVAAVLRDAFHLEANRSTICRAVDRVARRGEATWHALRDAARRSMVNGIDETGWNVATQLRWLWVVVSEQVTVSDNLPGRGFEQAASLLGRDYAGWLQHDGWAVYYKFLRAGHQSCIAHLLRRCGDMLEVCSPVAARYPLAVKAILEKGLGLRDRYQQGEISTHGLWTATGRLEAELDRLLARSYREAANQRLANHLCRERAYLFTFLYCPGLDATNNAAERALRPLVVARKNWGGNRSENGARAQAVLTSILTTARQQRKDPLDVLIELLVSPDKNKILDLVPSSRERARPPSGQRPTAVSDPRRPASDAEATMAGELVVSAGLAGGSAAASIPA